MVLKKDLFPEFEKIFENLNNDEIIKTLFNYFDSNEIKGLLEHFKKEFE